VSAVARPYASAEWIASTLATVGSTTSSCRGYGPDIKAILGLDFLLTAGALIDLRELELGFR
jgi:hypothetical protein